MSKPASEGGKGASECDYASKLREMNEALLVSSVRQHELTERAELAAAALRQTQKELRASNEALEQRVAERTAALTQNQQRLCALVKQLGRAEARERKRVAGELHDNLAQLLAVCKMRVSAIEAAAPPGSPTAANALAVKEFLGQGLDYTRTLMSDLRPEAFNEHDLAEAMRWVARRMGRHGLVVRVEDDGDAKPLGEELLTLVFDSVRELLFNVIKHAGTSQATVSLRRAAGEVCVTVSDAGAGFDRGRQAAAPSEQGGYGLFSITERLGLMGGRAEVRSARGRGTRVRLIVPLSSQQGQRPARDAPRPRTPASRRGRTEA